MSGRRSQHSNRSDYRLSRLGGVIAAVQRADVCGLGCRDVDLFL